MKTIRFIIGLVITIFSLGASAQTYYYFGEKKVPLKLLPHIKVILCEDTVKTPIHLDKGDSLIRKIYPENSIAYVYREGKNSQTYKRYSANPSAKVSVYPGYRADTGDLGAPTGCIHVKLKSLADSTLLKKVCKQYGCVICSSSRYSPTWYTIRMIPKPGRNPVILANTLKEKGYFESVGPEFWTPNMLQISYDPETTKQWGLYNAKDNVDISVSEAWNYATGRGIKIGVVDSGFDI